MRIAELYLGTALTLVTVGVGGDKRSTGSKALVVFDACPARRYFRAFTVGLVGVYMGIHEAVYRDHAVNMLTLLLGPYHSLRFYSRKRFTYQTV